MKRYLNGLDNFVLTNYIEFRWYKNGEYRQKATIAEISSSNSIKPIKVSCDEFESLLTNFYNHQTPMIKSSKFLAERIAAHAKLIYQVIQNIFVQAINKDKLLERQFNTLKQTVMHTLTPDEFADIYSQTIVYGLFSAKLNKSEIELTRENASFNIPETNPFLRELFSQLAGPSLNDGLTWIVNEVIALIENTKFEKIKQEFDENNEDPMIHFYETFLNHYKPTDRTARGVYYTPSSAVKFMIRTLDKVLKKEFSLIKGLADDSQTLRKKIDDDHKYDQYIPKVQILDPAIGTGTFMYHIVDFIHKQFSEKNQGMWSGYVRNNLLKRLYGFELLMAPYSIAHMKLGLKLKQTGYDFENGRQMNRLRVFLTNTLEQPKETGLLIMSEFIAGEAESANRVKSNEPIMAIIGNPPYSGESNNDIPWIKDLLKGYDAVQNKKVESYFHIDEKPLGEHNTKWLNDDYVKFFRFAQWKIAQRGYGVVIYITPHSFLDNPTFRGMRYSLMNTFDDLYFIDLHGNANKHDGSRGKKDQNIFKEVGTGIAITILIKKDRQRRKTRVFHTEIFGKRNDKKKWFDTNEFYSLEWEQITPKAPYYYFIPQNSKYSAEYQKEGFSIKDIMPIHSNGIVTARDKLTINWSPKEVIERVKHFSSMAVEEARSYYNLGDDVRDWKVKLAQSDINRNEISKDRVIPIQYRPYDKRYTYYTGKSKGYLCMPRDKVMKNIVKFNNISLITSRLTKGESFNHILMSRIATEAILLSSKTSNNAFHFPLWIYDENDSPSPNFTDTFIKCIESKVGYSFDSTDIWDSKEEDTFTSYDILGYIVSQMSSSFYKERYALELTQDFPKIQITSNSDLFVTLCQRGKRLIKVLLLENLPGIKTSYPISGSNYIKKSSVSFEQIDGDSGKLWINKTQFFDNVPLLSWEYFVGGYQLLKKWLLSSVSFLL